VKLENSWQVTRSYLNIAFEMLPKQPSEDVEEDATLDNYEFFLGQNELDLALYQLIELGEINDCDIKFWSNILAAAENMQLGDQVLEELRRKTKVSN
jgi:NH3-dependent NAD+ synthetase